MSNPFEILGIEPGASEEDIKKAYKKMAMEHHPDRHPEDKQAEDKFKEISAAYETLKKNNWQQEDFGGHFGFNGFSSVNINIEDLFQQAFGQGNPFGRGRKVGYVKTGRIYISLEEAYYGCEKKISISDTINCSACNGFGHKLSDEKCSICSGTGQLRSVRGAVVMASTCNACKGFGRTISSMCLECNGKGKKNLNQELTITIPQGTQHGAKINPTNDLQIQILYSPHKEYTIMDNKVDLISVKEIDMFTAILGGVIVTNTIGGIKNIKVPVGCQPETILRVKQAGMKFKHKTGDHLVKIKIQLPINLTEEQKELLQTLKQQLEENKND